MEVSGIAAEGETALKRIEECKPDIVTLDVELPGMSRLQALRHIRSGVAPERVAAYSNKVSGTVPAPRDHR